MRPLTAAHRPFIQPAKLRFAQEQPPKPVKVDLDQEALRLYREKKLSPWPMRIAGMLFPALLIGGFGLGAYNSVENARWQRPDGSITEKYEPGTELKSGTFHLDKPLYGGIIGGFFGIGAGIVAAIDRQNRVKKILAAEAQEGSSK